MGTILTIINSLFTAVKSNLCATVIKYIGYAFLIAIVIFGSWWEYDHITQEYYQSGITDTTAKFTAAQNELKAQLDKAQADADISRAALNAATAEKNKAAEQALADHAKQAEEFQAQLAQYQKDNQDALTAAVAETEAKTEVSTKEKLGIDAVKTLNQVLQYAKQETTNEDKKSGKTGSANCFGGNDNGLLLIENSIPGSVSR